MSEYFDCIAQEKIALKNLQMLNTVINVVRDCITVRANRGKQYPSNCKKLMSMEEIHNLLAVNYSPNALLNAIPLNSAVPVVAPITPTVLPLENTVKAAEQVPVLNAVTSVELAPVVVNDLPSSLRSEDKIKTDNLSSQDSLPKEKQIAPPIPLEYFLNKNNSKIIKTICLYYNAKSVQGTSGCKRGETCEHLHVCEYCWSKQHTKPNCPLLNWVNKKENIASFNAKFKEKVDSLPEGRKQLNVMEMCKICQIPCTSYKQYVAHMCGVRHERVVAWMVNNLDGPKTIDTVENSSLSMALTKSVPDNADKVVEKQNSLPQIKPRRKDIKKLLKLSEAINDLDASKTVVNALKVDAKPSGNYKLKVPTPTGFSAARQRGNFYSAANYTSYPTYPAESYNAFANQGAGINYSNTSNYDSNQHNNSPMGASPSIRLSAPSPMKW